MGNAPKNHQLTTPKIQKDIAHIATLETTNAIIADVGNDLFAIHVDEARDILRNKWLLFCIILIKLAILFSISVVLFM